MMQFRTIESMRGYAAWWVVAGHALKLTGGAWVLPEIAATFLQNGAMAVQTFMLISGFVIAHLLLSKGESYPRYITRRFFRLMPLFAITTIIAILLVPLYHYAFIENPFAYGKDMRLERFQSEADNWFAHTALHITLLHGVIPDTILKYASSAFLAPAWSLSLEWQFYLLAPFILLGMRHRRFLWVPILLIAVSIVSLSGVIGVWKYQSFLPIALPFFLWGMTSRLMFEERTPWTAISLSAISTAVYILLQPDIPFWQIITVAAIWIITVILCAHEASRLPFRHPVIDKLVYVIALNPVIAGFGRVSFSTYLAHIPVFTLIVGGFMAISGKVDRPSIALATLVAIIVTIPVSFVLYRYVEKPGIALGRRLATTDNLAPAV